MSNKTESILLGLVGEGVIPSLTPPMHEREAEALGLQLLYRPIDLLELGLPATAIGGLLSAARQLGFNGLNVTHPCKQLVLPFLDELSEEARQLGAVNTVLFAGTRSIGYNTDCSGFASAFAAGLPHAALDRVVQLGAGGAGSAVAYALLKSGAASLNLVDVDADRAVQRAAELSGLFPQQAITGHGIIDLPDLMPAADGLVHCTPVGMSAHPGLPLDAALLKSRHWVADIVYRPIETELVRTARALGCRVLDGGRMAVGQAQDAFGIFTGKTADPDRMRRHFLELIAAESVLSGVAG